MLGCVDWPSCSAGQDVDGFSWCVGECYMLCFLLKHAGQFILYLEAIAAYVMVLLKLYTMATQQGMLSMVAGVIVGMLT